MKECDFESSLTEAEIACKSKLHGLFDNVQTKRSTNPGLPDCNVFDIGYLYTPDGTTFNPCAYHWRAQLDLYRRDRTVLQKEIMRVLAAFPVNADYRPDDDLRANSNVLQFRVAPETRAVSEITTTQVGTDKDAKPIMTYTATIQFDVVFQARF